MSDVQFAALLVVFFLFSAFVVWVLGGEEKSADTTAASPEPVPAEPMPVAVQHTPTPPAAQQSVTPATHHAPTPATAQPAAANPTVDQQIVDIALKPQSQKPSPIAPTTTLAEPAPVAPIKHPAPDVRATLPPDAGMSQIYVAHALSDGEAATAPAQPPRPQFYDAPPARPAASAPAAAKAPEAPPASAAPQPSPPANTVTPPHPATPSAGPVPVAQPAPVTTAPVAASPSFTIPAETPLPLAASIYAAATAIAAASAPTPPQPTPPRPMSAAGHATATATPAAQTQTQTSSGWASRAASLPPSNAVELQAAAKPTPGQSTSAEPSARAERANTLPPSDAVEVKAAPASFASDVSDTMVSAPSSSSTNDDTGSVLLSTARRGTRLIGAGTSEAEFFDFDELPSPRPKTPSIWSRNYLRPSVAHTLPEPIEVLDVAPSVRAERIPVRAETLLVRKQDGTEAEEPKASSKASGTHVLAADIRYTLPPGALGND